MVLNMTSNFSGVPLSFAFMVLMGNTGVLTLLGQRLGVPLLESFDLYSGQGLMMVYVYFQIPLATLLLIPAFAGINPAWREAATILRAGAFDYWFRIAIPNLMPSLLGTLSVLFANALAAYASAYALVMNNYALLALQITSKYKGDVQIDKATGGALAVVLKAVPPNCTVVGNPGRIVRREGVAPQIDLDHVHLPDPIREHIVALERRVSELEEQMHNHYGTTVFKEDIQDDADL